MWHVLSQASEPRGDGAIINMHIMPKNGTTPTGLDKEKFFFDTDGDMLDLTEVLHLFEFVLCVTDGMYIPDCE